MSRIGFALSLLLVVAVAAWAYHVNYRTAEALKRVRGLEREIAAERERLAVLDVEWARLNAPDRLRRLVAAHNGRLLLMPLAPDHFGETAAVPFPPPPPLPPAPEGAPAAGDGAGEDLPGTPPLLSLAPAAPTGATGASSGNSAAGPAASPAASPAAPGDAMPVASADAAAALPALPPVRGAEHAAWRRP